MKPNNVSTPKWGNKEEPDPMAVDLPAIEVKPEIVELARDMVRRERRIAQMEAQLSKEKEELRVIQYTTMPDLMRTHNIRSQTMGDGWVLACEPFFRASLPALSTIEKADPEEAARLMSQLNAGIKWIEANRGGDIIRDTIKVELGKGQSAMAKQIMALVKKLKLSAERARKVHPATLAKFLREKIQAGADVPTETFSLSSGEVAKVVPPKVKKQKGEVNDGSKTAE